MREGTHKIFIALKHGDKWDIMLLSNPCNPTGKLVEGEELARWVSMARQLDWLFGGFTDFTSLVGIADPFDLAFATYTRPRSTTIDLEIAI